jgi:hypothetical protein
LTQPLVPLDLDDVEEEGVAASAAAGTEDDVLVTH